MKIINYLKFLFLFIGIGAVQAQSLWYENSSNTNHITLNTATKGTFTTGETNPETNGVNSNTTVSKFVRNGETNPIIRFDLNNPITDLSSYTVSLKAYTSIKTEDLNTQNQRIRLYLRNSTIGATSSIFEQLAFSEGDTWESFSFNFEDITIANDVATAGGFDQIMIGLANGDSTGLTTTYYFDTISGTTDQTAQVSNIAKADFLSGSWGVRFNLPGGYNLDDDSNYDWVAGAQEIVDNLPAVGHVITNFTHPAHGYFYTLRDNPYVDVATEIHPAMVPSLENEQIILDIINVIKNSGKKVILYINAGGPSNIQGSVDATEAEITVAWDNYCNTAPYNGDKGLAWRTLAKGYFERFKGLADGYWIDNLSSLPASEVAPFIAMIREVDPDIALATNLDKSYIEDENGVRIQVDSDGTDDADPTDYKVFFLEANDPYMDFTAGHPTPLGQGAPPNSWAYEEFSFPLITENPWSTYDGSKQTLKHYFAPIRQQWSVARADLIFEVEQAYRFVRTFTDAGAAITWSTTITNGYISDDEMSIMEDINNRMLQSPKPDFIPYVRPEGAYLVSETLSVNSNNFIENTLNLYPNPVTQNFKLSIEIESAIIYNLSGQKILEFNGNQTTYDVSTLNDGIYVFKSLSRNGESQFLKFIKH
ncbi:MAG: T9SS type A sorting domain-containing protein [Algibacter sp.]|uniref:T9SS type A sorting domain-containing protein n=1 Tax=Algibacter sp. TaxID=1872428 RepID=UPI003298D59C